MKKNVIRVKFAPFSLMVKNSSTDDTDCDQEPLEICASQRAAVQLKTEDHFIQMCSVWHNGNQCPFRELTGGTHAVLGFRSKVCAKYT